MAGGRAGGRDDDNGGDLPLRVASQEHLVGFCQFRMLE